MAFIGYGGSSCPSYESTMYPDEYGYDPSTKYLCVPTQRVRTQCEPPVRMSAVGWPVGRWVGYACASRALMVRRLMAGSRSSGARVFLSTQSTLSTRTRRRVDSSEHGGRPLSNPG